MNNCESCSNLFERCPDVITTNCIKYIGEDIECLGICKGTSMTIVEATVLQKLCEVVGLVNLSSIVIPPCLVSAWGTKDKTILNFISFLLDRICILDGRIDNVSLDIQNIDPLITVDFKCCSDAPCVTSGTIKVSKAIENIITCLCNLKSEVDVLNNLVSLLQRDVNDLEIAKNSLQTQINTLRTDISSLRTCTGC